VANPCVELSTRCSRPRLRCSRRAWDRDGQYQCEREPRRIRPEGWQPGAALSQHTGSLRSPHLQPALPGRLQVLSICLVVYPSNQEIRVAKQASVLFRQCHRAAIVKIRRDAAVVHSRSRKLSAGLAGRSLGFVGHQLAIVTNMVFLSGDWFFVSSPIWV